jgi:hypothetical protein
MEQAPESRALQDLGRAWGHLYDFAYRDSRYLARRVDGTGQALTADTADELDAAIRGDQAAR